VVRYVAHGATDDGDAFLAMEWLEGENLAARVERGPLSLAETLNLSACLAGALAAAHAVGIIHRDLKPSNVILAFNDVARPKLVDFGIARVVDRSKLTQTGAMLGTIGYMAPEQARGEPEIDARVDVFSLGALMFKCLTGHAPFEGDDAISVLLRQTTEDAPRLSDRLDGVPDAVDALVARMLAREPEGRPKDAAAVLDELARLGPISAGSPLAPRTPSSANATSTTRRAAPARPAARISPWPIVGAAALAAGLTALVLLRWGSHAAPARGGGSVAAHQEDCGYDRCDPFVAPNDLRQLVPKVRAHVTALEPDVMLVEFGMREPIRNATLGPDTDYTFTFRPAHRDSGVLIGIVSRGKLNLKWHDAKAALPPMGDPKCSLSRVLKVARTHDGLEGPVSVTLLGLGGETVWTVSTTSPKPAYVMVNDSTCEVRRLY
jgi:hypothetical protein